MKKIISRKKFLSTTVAGLAGIKLMSNTGRSNQEFVSQKREVGKTGIQVSPVCFGASRTNEESLIRYAIDKGINFIDTGHSYSNGNNERLVGRAVSGIRKKVVIQTKIRLDPHELTTGGKGKQGINEIRSILSSKTDASLKALNTDFIDILLYHDAEKEHLLFHDEVMRFFDEMKSSGVIKAHGFSAHNECIYLHERNNKELFYDIMMAPFNHKGSFIHSVSGQFSKWDQKRLIPVLAEAGKNKTGIIAMKTCSGGRYSPAPDVEPSFIEAIGWVIQHSYISSAAVAMSTFEQVNENISLLDYI